MTSDDRVDALRRGRAFVDLSSWTKVMVGGGDAVEWLNDLLTAEMTGIPPGEARRTLLLTPTGRLRADVAATPLEGGMLLVQPPDQPEGIEALLDRYVLSSDVTLEERTADLTLVAFSGGEAPAVDGTVQIRPSVLGVGVDLLGPRGEDIRAAASSMVEADARDVDRWRVERGVPRFPVDLTPESLPHEVPLDEAIAFDKGCYLGQEAVARVRNLGHPPFVALAATTDARADRGDQILSDGAPAGTITSATTLPDGRTAAIARVRWAARARPLTLADGAPLRVRPSAPA